VTGCGAQFGPDLTYLGVDRDDTEDGEALAGKHGTSHDSAGPLLQRRGTP
jgi:hypothetical protein